MIVDKVADPCTVQAGRRLLSSSTALGVEEGHLMAKSKAALFVDLAGPDEATGISRWVSTDEFIGEYIDLELGNGGSWCRKESTLAKRFVIEFDKSVTPRNRIDRIRLNGYQTQPIGNQAIRSDIRMEIQQHRCVVLGTSAVEVDHKNGRKDDPRVWEMATQQLTDFQPLSKAANDAKRQFCKECAATDRRYDAKRLGYPVSFTCGELTYHPDIGCVGCFWFDPLEFRKHLKDAKS